MSKVKRAHVETYLHGFLKANLTSNVLIEFNDWSQYYLNPNGTDRTVTFDNTGFKNGDTFRIRNTGTANILTVTNTSTIISSGEERRFIFDGSTWFVYTDSIITSGFTSDLTTLITANQTTYMTAATPYILVVTGNTNGQIICFPSATTLKIGHQWWIVNNSSIAISLQHFDGTNNYVLNPGSSVKIIVRDISTSGGIWSIILASSGIPMYAINCSYSAAAGVGRYLEFFPSNPSDSSPYVLIVNSLLCGLSLNSSSASTGTVGIFKSTDLVNPITTISLSNQSSIYTTSILISLTAGTLLSARVTSGSIQKPGLSLYLTNI